MIGISTAKSQDTFMPCMSSLLQVKSKFEIFVSGNHRVDKVEPEDVPLNGFCAPILRNNLLDYTIL